MDFTAKEKDGFYPTPYILAKMFNDKYHEYFGHVEGLVVWDASCGVGALTNSFEFNHPVYSSTLHTEDLEHVENPNKFQFDFLHGDVNTLPQELQDALKEGRVLYYQNPPYNKVATEYARTLTGQGWGVSTSMLRSLFFIRGLELNINKFMSIVPEQTLLSRAALPLLVKMPALNYCTGFPGSIFKDVDVPTICIFVNGADAPTSTEYILRDVELKPVMERGFQDYTKASYKDQVRKDSPPNTHRLPRFTSPYKLSTSRSGPQGKGLPANFPYTPDGIDGVPKKEGYGHYAPSLGGFDGTTRVPEALVPEDYVYTLGSADNNIESNNSLLTEPNNGDRGGCHPETLVPEDYSLWCFGGKNIMEQTQTLMTEPAGGASGVHGYPLSVNGVRDKLTYFAIREIGKSILPKTLWRTEPMAPDFTDPRYVELRELGFLYAMFAKQNYMVGGTIVENKLSLFKEWGLKKDEPVYIEGMKLMNKYKNEVPVDAGFWNVWNWFMDPREKADFNVVRNELAARIYKLAYEMDIYVKHESLTPSLG